MRILLATGFHPTKKMGGAEYQTWLLAKGLKDLGHEVTYLATNGEDQESYLDDAGVTIIEIPGWRVHGNTLHRDALARAFENVKPELVYIRVFEEIYFLSNECKAKDIPFVSMSVSAMETSPFLLGYHPRETASNLRSKLAIYHLLSFYALRDSAIHVCNLRGLQKKIEKWYPRKSLLTIYNGSPAPEIVPSQKIPSGQVVWVNNFKILKRPEIFIELARRLPNYRFLMIGRIDSGRYGKKIKAILANGPTNLKYLGPKPVEETNKIIRESDLLLYTSLPIEGFGNSFLQAWFREVPTVSYEFELDGILDKEAIGHCASDFNDLLRSVDSLMREDSNRQQMGTRAREYALKQFTVDRMVRDYEMLFRAVVNGNEAI